MEGGQAGGPRPRDLPGWPGVERWLQGRRARHCKGKHRGREVQAGDGGSVAIGARHGCPRAEGSVASAASEGAPAALSPGPARARGAAPGPGTATAGNVGPGGRGADRQCIPGLAGHAAKDAGVAAEGPRALRHGFLRPGSVAGTAAAAAHGSGHRGLAGAAGPDRAHHRRRARRSAATRAPGAGRRAATAAPATADHGLFGGAVAFR
mmetsp:Transcript_102189/g.284615  ORF Transcript_102189/g.284615 Transcript_102189/m.284615 type:complete len:208 (-) Transcript_102189:30-653(-)